MTSGRRGFVLATVLFAMVLLAALASRGFFAALQEMRAGRNTQGALRARSAAEAALSYAVARWDPRLLDALSIGAVVAAATPPLAGISVSATVRRLADHLFLVQSTAAAPGGAMASVATVIRLSLPETAPAASRVRLIGPGLAGFSSGLDQSPPGWNCAATNDTVSDAIVQAGAPDSSFFRFGAMNWPALTTWVGAVPPGGDTLGVRYEPGDATLAGGRTLGLLVVEGDLTLSAGAQHAGLVLVRGTLRLDGAGGVIFGSVVASQVIATNGYTASQPAVRYSVCAVELAGRSRALPVSLQGLRASGFF